MDSGTSRYSGNVQLRRKEERKKTIFDMWLACHTQQEIAKAVGVSKMEISREIEDCNKLADFPKSYKLSASYNDTALEPKIYDIWSFHKNTSATKQFGNTAVEIVDNLLYRFTKPFGIVIDPFAGSGSTIDICKKRLRRYWCSDLTPMPERKDIRKYDITKGIPGRAWQDVQLVYLDSPYWRQAKGEYSKSPDDLSNMSLGKFTDTMVNVINKYAAKLSVGAHIACIIQPTQWRADNKETVYHDIDFIRRVNKKLRLERHIICPYSTEQYTPQCVNEAKKSKMDLVLSRRLIIWRIVK